MIEYKLLSGIELAAVDPQGIPWPFDTFGIVELTDGQVTGRAAILNMPMLEGTWVHPDKRGSATLIHLMDKIEELYRSLGKTESWAMAEEDNKFVQRMMKTLGYERVPVLLYRKTLVKKEEAA